MSETISLASPDFLLPIEARSALDEDEQLSLRFLIDHPGINILIHFSPHGTAEDLGDESKFEKPLSRSDIYGIEEPGYELTEQITLNGIAKRLYPLDSILAATDDIYGRKLGVVYNTGVQAVLTDIDAKHRLSHEPGLLQLLPFMVTEYTNDDDNPENPRVQATAKLIADHETAREWVILSQLGKHVEELSKTDPVIAEKLESGNLNVFMTYGELHTGLFHKLREIGLDPKRTFAAKPVTYPALASLIRQKMFERTTRN